METVANKIHNFLHNTALGATVMFGASLGAYTGIRAASYIHYNVYKVTGKYAAPIKNGAACIIIGFTSVLGSLLAVKVIDKCRMIPTYNR